MPKNKIAQVVVDLPVDGPFDYEVPERLADSVSVGHRVLVSFQTKTLIGYIVGFKEKSAFHRLKPISSVLDKNPALPPAMLELAKEFSQHYCCSLGHAIAAFLPVGFKKLKKEIIFSAFQENEKQTTPSETLLLHDFLFKHFWPILIERIQNTVAQGLGVIILVPETYRIASVVQELKTRGMSAPITIFDKKLKDKEQIENWALIKEGKAKIVVGTRSAIFAPVVSLSLIVMMDESNFSYKQDQSPFYHARQVAMMRAKNENASLVFVTRSFSVDLYNLLKKKKITFVDAANGEKPCAVQVVDLSNYKYGKAKVISIPLQYAMEKVLSQNGKILLVMNKKGFGSFGACSKCHHVLKCPHCDIPLTFLYEQKKVVCRHCSYQAPCPSVCPQCQGAYINFTGMGIEKLESEASRLFPKAKVVCYAKESSTLPSGFDILIATQAVIRFD
ncbi:MAG: primosomal protein N', partial [Candidatus Omnitrophica bacterium]|nr:primosomal protein N' [Candidatus Omnitrophota bacterium]